MVVGLDFEYNYNESTDIKSAVLASSGVASSDQNHFVEMIVPTSSPS
jgi:hypothetical protein